MSETAQTTEPTAPAPKPARRRRAGRARPAAEPAAPRKTNELAGIGPKTCPTACTPERCVISTVGVCKHPYMVGDAGCGQITLRNREAAKKVLKRQKIDA